jgi:hypothetical protein
MPKIVPLVEGDGDVMAVPLLLRDALARLQRWDFEIARPRNAHGRGNLTKQDGIERFVRLCLKEPERDAILILIDADADCAATIGLDLAIRVRAVRSTVPIVIVLAKREYETWFVASIQTIAGKQLAGRPGITAEAIPPEEPEAVPNPKAWLSQRMPPGRAYKETEDQAPMTSSLDFQIVANSCRSFRRLLNAVQQLVQAVDAGNVIVTP